ncbi:MAG: molecular chaperone DnaK, partial [Crenarchaeota archaeon]|nr:molecular chaperone DnaK [Thermoproteota archaeon]
AKITITASTKLSKEEKERMIKDAEQFAEQDKKKREEAELRNNADSLLYTAERTKKDLADKLNQEQTGKIDTAVSALKDALATNDMAQIKAKTDELQKVLQEVGTVIYQQAAAERAKQKGQPNQEASATKKGKVVDSEDYEVK